MSLDWLRTALADMLITDLPRSPQIQVLSTDTLYKVLAEMNRLDDRVTSLEVVPEVAERGNVETALLGRFVKAGDTIRICVRGQEWQDSHHGKSRGCGRVKHILHG